MKKRSFLPGCITAAWILKYLAAGVVYAASAFFTRKWLERKNRKI